MEGKERRKEQKVDAKKMTAAQGVYRFRDIFLAREFSNRFGLWMVHGENEIIVTIPRIAATLEKQGFEIVL